MRKPENQPRTPAPHHQEHEWLARARGLYGRYGGHVLVATLIVLVLALFYQGFRSKAGNQRIESWRALDALPLAPGWSAGPRERAEQARQVIRDCQAILENHWKTDATPWVLLRLAEAQRDSGDLKGAVVTYEQIWREYPKSETARIAAPSYAGALSDDGRQQAAANIYTEIAAKDGPTSRYWFDVGRNLEMAGDREGALKAYAKLGEANPDEPLGPAAMSAWRRHALTAGSPLLPAPPPPPALPETETEILGGLPSLRIDTEVHVPKAETEIPEAAPHGETGGPEKTSQER